MSKTFTRLGFMLAFITNVEKYTSMSTCNINLKYTIVQVDGQ